MSKQTARKRKGKKSGGPKATNSFAALVGNAQTNALKPYIEQLVQMASYQAIQSLSRPVLNHVQAVQQTQLAMLRLLKAGEAITDESMMCTAMDIEDEALEVSATEEAAKEGDLVRIDFKSKLENQDEFNPSERVQINSLASKNASGTVQTNIVELEEALVGKAAGDVVEINIPGEGEAPLATIMNMTILRVSTKKEAVSE